MKTIDKQSRPVPVADNRIVFKVSGEGALIGVGNGDPNCQESDKEPSRSLFNGRAQAILQSTRTPGTIQVTAKRYGLTAGDLTITTKQVPLRPSI